MKASKLREQTSEEMDSLRREMRKELMDLRIKGTHREDSPGQPLRKRTLRRDLARIETIMKERGARDNG